jgi:hypothetical protein
VRRKADEIHAVIAHGHQAHVSAGAVAGLPAEECMSNDGALAFPGFNYVSSNVHDGMTLRDYFAAKAMQALLSDPNVDMTEATLTRGAYRLADAMLKAREA